MPASVVQHELAFGTRRAVVTELGAALRCYGLAGEPVCLGLGEGEVVTGAGARCWHPGRTVSPMAATASKAATARRRWTSPVNGNAMHGLVHALPREAETSSESSVGWPALLPQLATRSSCVSRSSTGSVPADTLAPAATNAGAWRAPFGGLPQLLVHAGGLVSPLVTAEGLVAPAPGSASRPAGGSALPGARGA